MRSTADAVGTGGCVGDAMAADNNPGLGSALVTELWTNWGRNQTCAAEAVDHPADEAEVAAAVKAAGAAGQTVKAVGSGHSFTDIACTHGRRLELDRYGEIVSVDRERRQITVQAGCTIRTLNRRLAELGWALPNLGDIEYQTISGAVSTATHGTGIKLGGLATQIVGLELVTGDGSVLRCSGDEEPEVVACGRGGRAALLGRVPRPGPVLARPAHGLAGDYAHEPDVLGPRRVLGKLVGQFVAAGQRPSREGTVLVLEVLDNLDVEVEDNDHFEFYYV